MEISNQFSSAKANSITSAAGLPLLTVRYAIERYFLEPKRA
jgi:hypothetical protein